MRYKVFIILVLMLCIIPLMEHTDVQAATTDGVIISEPGIYLDPFRTPVSISGDGRYVAFYTNEQLTDDDIVTRVCDVYVYDRQIGSIELISKSYNGPYGTGGTGSYLSSPLSISDDGRYLVFVSTACNLIPGGYTDDCGYGRAYIKDRQTGTIEQILPSRGYCYQASISRDGRYVVLNVDSGGGLSSDVYLYDTVAKSFDKITVSIDGQPNNGMCYSPSVSDDGNYVTFTSSSTNLVNGVTNGEEHVFVRDRLTHTTELVSVSSEGMQGNYGDYDSVISADGRFVAFISGSSNLVAGDTNGGLFVRDRLLGTTELISIASDGGPANGYVGFEQHYYPYDPDVFGLSISQDGRFVTFSSTASNLVPGDTNGANDVFVRDRLKGVTNRISTTSTGVQGNGISWAAGISSDGRWVLFSSYAPNLCVGDTYLKAGFLVKANEIAPESVSLSPNSGKLKVGVKTTLRSTYSDEDGVSRISACYLLLNGSIDGAQCPYLMYQQSSNRLYLRNDSNTGWIGGYAPGTSRIIQNSYCKLYCAQTTLSADDNDRTINWCIELKPTMAGRTVNAYMNIINKAKLTSGWGQMGSFSINAFPVNVSLTPNSATLQTGSATTLTSTVSDPDGYSDISKVCLLLNSSVNSANTAFFYYDAASNKLYVRNDSGTAWTGGFAPGSSSIIQNSYCKLYCANTTITHTDNGVTVNWKVEMKPTMSGRDVNGYMYVFDASGDTDGWDNAGVFSIRSTSGHRDQLATSTSRR